MDNIKKSRKRATKDERYKEQRIKLINTLNEILDLKNNNEFFIYELENNKLLIDKLIDLIPEIRIYYKYSTWGYFSEHNPDSKNPLSLLKALYNHSGYKVYSSKKVSTYNNIKKQYRYYKIVEEEKVYQ